MQEKSGKEVETRLRQGIMEKNEQKRRLAESVKGKGKVKQNALSKKIEELID